MSPATDASVGQISRPLHHDAAPEPTIVEYLTNPALWATLIGLAWGAFQLFGQHVQVCPPITPFNPPPQGGFITSGCYDEGLVAIHRDGIFPVPLAAIVVCALAPLLGVAGVLVASKRKVRGAQLIALAMIVEFSSLLTIQLPEGQYDPKGWWTLRGVLSGNFAFAYVCGPLLLLQLRRTLRPRRLTPAMSTAAATEASEKSRVATARTLAVVVSFLMAILVLIFFGGLAFIGYKYAPADLARMYALLALSVAAVVGFDLTVVMGAQRRWAYTKRAAAVFLFIAGVCYVVASTTSYD